MKQQQLRRWENPEFNYSVVSLGQSKVTVLDGHPMTTHIEYNPVVCAGCVRIYTEYQSASDYHIKMSGDLYSTPWNLRILLARIG